MSTGFFCFSSRGGTLIEGARRTAGYARIASELVSGTERRADDSAPGATVVALRGHRSVGGRSSTRASWTEHHRSRDEGGASVKSAEARGVLLDDSELDAIEKTYAGGITAVQIVQVFASRGLKFSEASFRKYVQQGLLPRSRRVGRKGKHRGSLGVYPAKTVRRINTVKRLMADGHTIEEIQGQFLQFTDLVENMGEGLSELLARLDREVAGRSDGDRKVFVRELQELRRLADDITHRLDQLARRIAAPGAEKNRRTGAAGSAEDLL
jgi:hypothetical protein